MIYKLRSFCCSVSVVLSSVHVSCTQCWAEYQTRHTPCHHLQKSTTAVIPPDQYVYSLVACLCASNQPWPISIHLHLSLEFRLHTRLPRKRKGFWRNNRNFEDQFGSGGLLFAVYSRIKRSPAGTSIWHCPHVIYTHTKRIRTGQWSIVPDFQSGIWGKHLQYYTTINTE